MFTNKFFEKHHLTAKDLRGKFAKVKTGLTAPGKPSNTNEEQKLVSGIPTSSVKIDIFSYPKPIKDLVWRINSRLKDGINRNLVDSKIYWAIDKAYDVGFQQIPPTLVESLMDREADGEKVHSIMNEWGLGYLITPATCRCGATPCSCGSKDKKVLNLPAFFRVFVPLVKAYVGIRWAKIYTDRNVYPLYKYEPMKSTPLNRIRTEIITDRVQMMASQFGLNTIMRQEIFQALLYSFAFSFPKESWYKEKMEFVDDDQKSREITLKEGLRYNTPHPSRVFIDPADRPSTFNTDSGCTWAAYWNIVPWRSITESKNYWNLEYVTYGNDWINRSPSYFQEIFPCSLRFPTNSCNSGVDGGTTGHAQQLRDERMDSFYTTSDSDKAVVLTEYFEKLNPSQYGLSDYDGDVWFRFVIASDDTVVYCEPLPYCPVIYTGYDADENRARNTSLALEVMPFQDHVGNLLSQYILSVKQNLEKAVFYNTDVVDANHITDLKNLGEKRLRTIQYIPFSGRESITFGQTGPQNAFLPVTFPIQNTQEIASSISAIINILERLLALSAQELGQTATHEQTAQESVIIANNVSTRLGFTASFVDDASQARKVQLYRALMAYGSEEVYAQIEGDSTITRQLLDKIGFEVVEDDTTADGVQVLTQDGEAVVVKGSKKGLILEGFVSNREGENRINGPQVAAALANFVAAFSNSSSVLLQTLGPEQTIVLFNQMATFAGFPRDFRLKVNPLIKKQFESQMSGMPDQNALNAMQQQIAKAIADSQGQTLEQVAKAMGPLQEVLKSLQSNDQQQNQAIQQLLQALNGVAALAPTPPPIQNDLSAAQPPPTI
jgi:hypothetical protein